MRTTIRLDDRLLRRAKAAAAMSGRSLNELIGDALRTALAPRRVAAEPGDLPTDGRGGPLRGVDLDSNAALLDLMDRLPGNDAG